MLLPRLEELARVPPDAPGHFDSCDTLDGAERGSRTIVRGDALVLEGWCADPATLAPASEVVVMLGDRVVMAAGAIERPDIAEMLHVPRDSAGYGFSARLDTTGVSLGTYVVRAALRGAGGSWHAVRDAALVEIAPSAHDSSIAGMPASERVVIDSIVRTSDGVPIDTAFENDVVHVRGWALDAQRLLARNVAIAVDGTIVGDAVYGLPRPDVREHFGLDAARALCGFRFRLEARHVGAGRHEIQAVLRDGRDTFAIAETPRSLTIVKANTAGAPAMQRPAGRFDEARIVRSDGTIDPAPGLPRVAPGETIIVRGWAADAERRADPLGVFVVLDGGIPIEARAGLPRPDIHDALRYGSRSGFDAAVRLNGIALGPHVLEAYIVSADGGVLVPIGARLHFEVAAGASRTAHRANQRTQRTP